MGPAALAHGAGHLLHRGVTLLGFSFVVQEERAHAPAPSQEKPITTQVTIPIFLP